VTLLLASLGLALVAGLGATLLCERLAHRIGLVVRPRADRWHGEPVPLLGGVAIIVGVLVSLVVVGVPSGSGPFLVVAVAMGAVGLIDDLRPLRPQAKLVAQIVLAGVMIQKGYLLRLTGYPVLDVVLTLFWIVGVTNAFNLLDNMDGLAAGMATLTAAFRLAFFVMDGDLEGARLTAAFMGGTLGFLVRNFPPAKIFMGDAGSLFLGFFLSGVCLVGESAYSRGVAALLVFPVLLVLIPIFDTTFVTLTRLVTGRPVSQGGRDHTSHRLVGLGITEHQALAFLYGISLLSGLLAVVSYRYGFTHTVVFLALLLVGLFLLGVHLSRVQVVRAETADAASDTRIVRFVADFPFKRQVATVTIDLLLIVVAYYSAYLLRFEGAFDEHRDVFLQSVGPVIVLQISSLALLGSYRGLWRYTSLPDLLLLVRGASLGVATTVLYFVFATRLENLSRAVFVLDWLLLVALLSGSRVSFRLLREMLRPQSGGRRRVLIYGAGDGGELTLRELRKNPQLQREPVGFLDDDRFKVGTRIHEVPVLGTLESLDELVAAHRIGEVIVSSERIPSDRIRRLEQICASQGVQVVRAAIRLE
jgi:UDP-GlcNAc:undecaprenyl-phosphate GlcNAc-1-phosphate transferase